MAILSRYPVREIRRSGPPRGGWFPAWLLEVTLGKGRRVRLLNVHLRPPLSDSGRLSSVLSAYFSTRSIRLREIRRHLPRVSQRDLPLIVLGDFNESDGGRAHRFLQRLGLRSALGTFDRHSPTWRWRTSVGTLRSRLDHIYYSRGLRCMGAQVLGEAASDHYPVEAVFRIERPGGRHK
jgi:endonuclease/exonuclease/phosphatase family metal-dependent hydrolase